ncbi:MAG: amidase [Paraglaciecola psychrophila]|jgi:amidase
MCLACDIEVPTQGLINMTQEAWQQSATSLINNFNNGKLTSEEAVESVLNRTAQVNPPVNAIVDAMGEEARQKAKDADLARKNGKALGPLHGVPITIKVNVDVAGHSTDNGVVGLKDVIATQNSPVVDNLLKAGAIIIGRTNTPEFSFRLTTINELYGRTVNPWNKDLMPGGSSGGAGVAVAMGMGPIGHGNDIGGSLRVPAAFNGVATIRPSLGRVPAFNPSQPAERGMLAQLASVQGVITRNISDLRLATQVCMQEDSRDPWWVPVPFNGPVIDGPIKVAFTKASYGYDIDPEIVKALDNTADILSNAGYDVEEVNPPSVKEISDFYMRLLMGEVKQLTQQAIDTLGSEQIKRVFELYYKIQDPFSPSEYMAAMAQRTAYTRAWNLFLDQYPLVLSPFIMKKNFPFDYDAHGLEQCRDLIDASCYSFAFNGLGLPCAVFPVALSEDGLPLSVQIIGKRFREDLCLDAAQAIEKEVGTFTEKLWTK